MPVLRMGCRGAIHKIRKQLARPGAACQLSGAPAASRMPARCRRSKGRPMAQVIIRRSTIDLAGLPQTIRDEHARFLRNWRDALVTFGPILRGAAPAGYL